MRAFSKLQRVSVATQSLSNELLQPQLKLQRDGPVLCQPELRPVDSPRAAM